MRVSRHKEMELVRPRSGPLIPTGDIKSCTRFDIKTLLQLKFDIGVVTKGRPRVTMYTVLLYLLTKDYRCRRKSMT